MDLSYASASDLTAALARGDLSSRELLDHVVARIEAVNPPLNAVVTLDVERATGAATAADDALARGEVLGSLHGLVMTVKDVWETEGCLTTSGAPELGDHLPERDAVAVARLRAAGAVIVGKTNTPLYAGDNQTFNDVFGQTNNPWDLERTTGGSSGGSAAAVAAGITPLELGSDIGGSVRAPAHFCGVYGLKPSWRVIPSRGHIPGPPGSLGEADVNQGGPLARSVADLRLGLDVMAGPLEDEAIGWTLDLPEGDPAPSLSGLRLGVVFDDDTFKVSREVQDVLRAFVDRLSDAGAKIEEQKPPVSMVDAVDSWQRLVLSLVGAGLPDDLYDAFSAFDPNSDEPLVRAGGQLTLRHRDWLRANDVRQHQRHVWQDWFADHDAFLAPIMPVAAFPHDTEKPIQERVLSFDDHVARGLDLVAWAGAFGAVLLPAAVIPAGSTPSGLPVGIQIVGSYLQDRQLLHMAGAFDQLGPGFPPTPWLLTTMRFIIYGAGAIGGAIGGRLAESGHDVVLIARGDHFEVLRRNGLTVESPDRVVISKLPVIDHPGALTFVDSDVVIFAMKTQHTVAAARDLARVAPPDIAIASAQNGVQNERMLLRRFRNVYGICVMCPAAHVEPGVVQAYSSPITGLLDVGRWAAPIDDVSVAIAEALRASTFESEPRDAIARWKYGKLLMNLGNAVEALCGHVEGIGPVMRLARAEGVQVLEAAGIDFVDRDEDQPRRGNLMTMGEIEGRPRGGGSSWQSLQRGTGNIEADYLNGEIVLLGRLHGVPTPVNELLQRRANRAAEDHQTPGRVTPDQLVAALGV